LRERHLIGVWGQRPNQCPVPGEAHSWRNPRSRPGKQQGGVSVRSPPRVARELNQAVEDGKVDGTRLGEDVQGSVLVLASKRAALDKHADEIKRAEGTDASGSGYLAKREVVGPQRELLILLAKSVVAYMGEWGPLSGVDG